MVGDRDTKPRVIANTDVETAAHFIRSFDADDDAVLAGARHSRNRAPASVDARQQIPGGEVPSSKPVIPTPLKLEPEEDNDDGEVHIDSTWKVVHLERRLANEAHFIASKM